MHLDPAEAFEARIIQLLANHAGIVIVSYPREEWAELDHHVTADELQSGWANLLPRDDFDASLLGVTSEVDYAFRFCPEVMVAHVTDLPDGDPTTWGDRLELGTKDAVARVITHVLNHQFIALETGADAANAAAIALMSISAGEFGEATIDMTLREST